MTVTYRADQVGSLLRPAELVSARQNPETTPDRSKHWKTGTSCACWRARKKSASNIFTDGEFRRGGFMSDFYDSVEGFDDQAAVARTWKPGGARPRTPFRESAPSPASWSRNFVRPSD